MVGLAAQRGLRGLFVGELSPVLGLPDDLLCLTSRHNDLNSKFGVDGQEIAMLSLSIKFPSCPPERCRREFILNNPH
jgi:hypothetical protein